MKRSWSGFFLLLVLLLAGLFSAWQMTGIHEPIEAQLLQAAYWASVEEWKTAGKFFEKARESWKNSEHFRSCFADHNPVEDIDAAFAMLEVYCTAREEITFQAACRDLARKVAAVGEAHKLVWWNLL